MLPAASDVMLSGWTRLPWIRMSAGAEAAGRLAHPAVKAAASIMTKRIEIPPCWVPRARQGFTYPLAPGKNRTKTTRGGRNAAHPRVDCRTCRAEPVRERAGLGRRRYDAPCRCGDPGRRLAKL